MMFYDTNVSTLTQVADIEEALRNFAAI